MVQMFRKPVCELLRLEEIPRSRLSRLVYLIGDQRPSGLGEVQPIEHFAVKLHGACVGLGLKGRDDAMGKIDVFFGRGNRPGQTAHGPFQWPQAG